MMDETLVQGSLDTLRAGALQVEGHGEENLFVELLHHVQDSHELEIPFLGHIELPQFTPFEIAGLTIDMSITKHVFFLWFAALLLCLLAIVAARKNRKHPVPTGFGNLVEVLVVFIRDQVVVPNMGSGGIRYMPYLLTTFFFILVMNLLGLVPFGASATGNVSTTAGLAIIAFIMIQVAPIRTQGLGHYLAHLTGGVHWTLWPIMVPIEILGLFTKPFALCIRLFANMTAGHIVIVSLIGLIFVFKSYIVAIAPVGFVLGISLLELFVAVLQAYIFTILTAMFMGLGMQTEGHGEHVESGH
ncbi:MAG: F0F1 ATP synthase subunit A [Ignavibacteria bacterium]|nr:F0F1 ATP synthase subunit A [Ignavibacteria bacterium]